MSQDTARQQGVVDLGDHFTYLTFMVMFFIISHYQNTTLSVSFIFMRGPYPVHFDTYYDKYVIGELQYIYLILFPRKMLN
jgi:hypothetical protein